MNIIKIVENDGCYDFCAGYMGENLNIDKIVYFEKKKKVSKDQI